VLAEAVVSGVLDDYQQAPISNKLRVMLAFLEKLTLSPEGVSKQDASALKAEGITRSEAVDAIYVAVLFCVYNRLADALGFALPQDNFQMAPKILLSFVGYR
jgi:alkylhydroperoxidase family enzyme